MRKAFVCAWVMMGLFIFASVGCEQADETATPEAPEMTTPMEGTEPGPGTPTTLPSMEQGAAAMEGAKEQAAEAVEGAKADAAEAAKTLNVDAQKLLDQAMQYIKENKLDLAEKTIQQLEQMGDKLPPTVKQGLEQAKSALASAKAARGQ